VTAASLRSRLFVLAVASLIAAQAGATAPAVLAAGPATTVSPSLAPSPDPTVPADPPATTSPAPSEAVTPTPDPTSAPTVSPAVSPLVPVETPGPKAQPAESNTDHEIGVGDVASLRTPTSQTFVNPDATSTTEFFTNPVFYQPRGASGLEPIDVGFTPDSNVDDAITARSDRAPVGVALAPANTADGFVTTTSGDQTIGFGLPEAQRSKAPAAAPVLDGPAADYRDILPGVDLRVLAEADGAKSFVIWHAAPTEPTITLAVSAPGMTLRLEKDGTISFLDAKGDQVARMPRPYAIDSTPDATLGSGVFTDKVGYALDQTGTTVTISVDPDWLKAAIYPVFIDPTVTWANAGGLSYGDAHIASGYNTTNFSNYQRPDSPYYHELWLGTDPSGTSGTSYDYLRWDLSTLTGQTIDSASFDIYPYHQYYNAPTSTTTWLRRVTAIDGQTSWQETYPTWTHQYSATSTGMSTKGCVELTTCTFTTNIAAMVQAWADGTNPNYGIRLDENSNGSTYWKRLEAAEQGGSHVEHLTVTYHRPTVTGTTAAFGGSVTWTYADTSGDPQATYHVDIATTSAFTTIVANSGDVAGSATGWLIQPTTSGVMVDDTVYWYRVKSYDGNSWSSYATGSFTYDAYQRGEESYYARTPFDLSGGWTLAVGAHNGEASLTRSFFSIPSYGPPQALELSYSSAGPTTAGMLGAGWTSNLSEYLSFENGLVVWHRSDGGRVAFPGAGGAAYGGHFETLTVGASDVVTLKDQTKLTFQVASPGHLMSIANRFGKTLTMAGWGTSTVTATDASGRATTLAIDLTNGRITSVTDSTTTRTWTFGYTGTGTASDLTTITEPDPDNVPGGSNGPLPAPATSFNYTAHQLTSITRNRTKAAGGTEGVTWAVAYDTAGHVSTITDPLGALASPVATNNFTYTLATTSTPTKTDVALLNVYSPVSKLTTHYTLDGLGRPITVVDPANWTATQTFDAKGDLLTTVRPVDVTPHYGTTTYSYDTAGNVLTETDPLTASTNVTTVMSYNITNDPLTRSQADSDAAVKVVTLNAYDGVGHLTSVVENCTTSGTAPPSPASGCTAGGTHDAATNITTTYTYTANDQVDVEWDARGYATKHLYDAAGNETSTVANCTSSGTTPPTRGTSCTGAGLQDATTNVTTTHAFSVSVTAGKIGLATSRTDPVGNAITAGYDELGRQTSEGLPGDAGPTVSIGTMSHATAYDEFGETLTTIDSWTVPSPVAQMTTTVYDLIGHEVTITDPAGGVTTTTYDAAGNARTTQMPDGATTSRTFDALNRLASESTNGTQTTHAYDPQDRETTTTVTTAPALTTTRVFDYGGRLTSETINDGTPHTTTHGYDSLGRETTSTDPSGAITDTAYDRTGRTTGVRQHGSGIADVTTATAYDAAGEAVSVTGPYPTGTPTGAVVNTTVYDPLSRAAVATANYIAGSSDPNANIVTTTFYDAAGHTIAVQDPKLVVTRTIPNARGLAATTTENCTDSPSSAPAACVGNVAPNDTVNIVTAVSYDGSGAVVQSVRADTTGGVTTTSTLDAASRLVATVLDPGSGSHLNLTTKYAYDSAGHQTAMMDPRGTVARSIYDVTSGRPTSMIANCTDSGTTPPSGPAWASCSGLGTHDGSTNLVTSFTYDAHGNVASESAPNGRITRSAYDASDRLCRTLDNASVDLQALADPCSTTVSGTATTNLSTFVYYDAAGREVALKEPTADASTFIVTWTGYDDLGRVTKQIRNCTDTGISVPTDPAACTGGGTIDAGTNLITTFVYDAHGNKLSMTAPDPSATNGTSASVVTTRYAYDANDRLCRVLENATIDLQNLTDPCSTAVTGSATSNISTRYAYDAAGNLISMIDAASHTTAYGFDAHGRMISLTDADSHALSWTYDGRGNRLTQTNRNGSIVNWTYDAANRTASRLADGVTTSYGYDPSGNQISVAVGSQTISTTYDRLGRALVVSDSTDSVAMTSTTYGFTSPTRTDPSSATPYSFTLDPFGRETTMVDPIHGAGSPWTTTYRADGQPASLAAPNGNTTAYAYNPAGLAIGMTTTAAGPVTRASYAYTLNRAGQRLTETSTISGDPSNGTVTFGYDPLGRLATYSGIAGYAGAPSQTYGWDKVPNRLTKQVGGGSTVTTTFDPANRPTSDTSPATYGYNLDGQLTARPGQTLTWDSLGRLTSVLVGGTTSTYAYDPLDRLASVTRGASVTKFRFVGTTPSIAQARDASNVVLYNVAASLAGEGRFEFSPGGLSQSFYGLNGHHDLTWVANASGVLTETTRYDPWGNPTLTSGSGAPNFAFQGSWYDPTTQLAWAVARWYAPALGTFVSEDSLLGNSVTPTSRHLYGYGAGEPVGRSDPGGLFWFKWGRESLEQVGQRYLGLWGNLGASRSRAIYTVNQNRLRFASAPYFSPGTCVWVPREVWISYPVSIPLWKRCSPSSFVRTGDIKHYGDTTTERAADAVLGNWTDWYLLTRSKLRDITISQTKRQPSTTGHVSAYGANEQWGDDYAILGWFANRWSNKALFAPANVYLLWGRPWWTPLTWPPGANAVTYGKYIFLRDGLDPDHMSYAMLSHEYIHVLQWQGRGFDFASEYLRMIRSGQNTFDPGNRLEAIAYLWQGWIQYYYPHYQGRLPWTIFRPLP
jgi:RHS repeat-associated protein